MSLHRILFSFLVAILFGANSTRSQTSSKPSTGEAQTSGASPTSPIRETASPVAPGTMIPAELSKSIDARRIKSGDKIEAKTTMDLLAHGQIVIPRDTKVIGHVTEAKPRSKESPESLVGVTFDRIALKDGRELPVRASVQAIGRSLHGLPVPGNEPAGRAPMDAASANNPDGRGTMGGPSRRGGPPSYPASNTPELPSGTAVSGGSAGSVLGPHSQGVVGMKGLQLSTSGQASVVISNSNNVHLDSGTQLVLRIE